MSSLRLNRLLSGVGGDFGSAIRSNIEGVATLIAVPGDAWSEVRIGFLQRRIYYYPLASLPQQTGLRRLRFLMFRISRRIEIKILQPVILAGFEQNAREHPGLSFFSSFSLRRCCI